MQRAGQQVGQAQSRRQQSERNLIFQEQALGTEAQVAGQLGGVSADVAPYIGRYTLNVQGAQFAPDKLQNDLTIVNDFMQQAEDAARAGDFRAASQFRAQAEQATSGQAGYYGLNLDPANIRALFNFDVSPEEQGRSALGSPMARTLGALVKQGREFLDPESETSLRYKRSLTEGAERAIASESRQAQRAQRDIGLQYGAGRSAMQERSIAARTQEAFARERAQVYTTANAQFEQFSRKFAASSVQLGQAWLQNQGGIREQYQGAMDQLTSTAVNVSIEASRRHAVFSARSGARAAASKAAQRARIIAIGTAVLGGAAGFMAAGAGLMGGASGMAGATIGASGALGPAMTAASKLEIGVDY